MTESASPNPLQLTLIFVHMILSWSSLKTVTNILIPVQFWLLDLKKIIQSGTQQCMLCPALWVVLRHAGLWQIVFNVMLLIVVRERTKAVTSVHCISVRTLYPKNINLCWLAVYKHFKQKTKQNKTDCIKRVLAHQVHQRAFWRVGLVVADGLHVSNWLCSF